MLVGQNIGHQSDVSLDERSRLRDAWDTVRLSATLDHAFTNSPFYADTWSAAGVSPDAFESLADITRFPLVRKSTFANDPLKLVSRVDQPDSIRDTSGTTGIRLPVYTNFDEDRALSQLRIGRSVGHPSTRLALRILPPPQRLNPSPYQDPRRSTRSLQMHVQPRYDPSVWYDAVDMAIGILLQDYSVGAEPSFVEVIHATPPPLFDYLTREILARGITPASFGVHEIALTGGPLSPGVRAFVEEAWQAGITTSYSCTEIRGELLECTVDTGVVHAGLSVLAEVLDLQTGMPVSDGEIGEVALTGFVPFQKVMPMVRYCPGDIAQFHFGPCACGSARPGIRILGRTSQHVDLSEVIGNPVRFGTTAVLDAIGTTPQIPRFPYPKFHAELRRGGTETPLLQVEIEATHPGAYDASAIEARLRSAMLSADTALAEAVARDALELRFKLCIKNSLQQFYRLYPGR